jgi:hypothetical protein
MIINNDKIVELTGEHRFQRLLLLFIGNSHNQFSNKSPYKEFIIDLLRHIKIFNSQGVSILLKEAIRINVLRKEHFNDIPEDHDLKSPYY